MKTSIINTPNSESIMPIFQSPLPFNRMRNVTMTHASLTLRNPFESHESKLASTSRQVATSGSLISKRANFEKNYPKSQIPLFDDVVS